MLHLLLFVRYHDFFMCLETICTRYGLDTELTPTSLVQNMHLQVLRIIFVLEAVFSLSEHSAVHVNELKNMRAFSRSRDRAQNIAESICSSFDCMRNQLGLHMLSQMDLQGLIYRMSRFLHASGNNLHTIWAGHRAFSHVIGGERAPSSPPNHFFAWSHLFTVITLRRPCERIRKTWGHSPGQKIEYKT